jgi:hypothetical protein
MMRGDINRAWALLDIEGTPPANIERFIDYIAARTVEAIHKQQAPCNARMAQAEAIEALQQCQTETDTERAHSNADNILCRLLNELGCEDVVDEYNKIDRWRA